MCQQSRPPELFCHVCIVFKHGSPVGATAVVLADQIEWIGWQILYKFNPHTEINEPKSRAQHARRFSKEHAVILDCARYSVAEAVLHFASRRRHKAFTRSAATTKQAGTPACLTCRCVHYSFLAVIKFLKRNEKLLLGETETLQCRNIALHCTVYQGGRWVCVLPSTVCLVNCWMRAEASRYSGLMA
jgi:hypothetical protein